LIPPIDSQHEDLAMQRRELIRNVGLGLTALSTAPFALAQTSAAKDLTIYIGYPAGGSPDLVARTISRRLGETLNRNVIVDNKAGASGQLVMNLLKSAPKDGSVLVLSPSVPVVMAPLLFPKLQYVPATDFVEVGRVVSFDLCLVVPASHPAKTAKEFLEWAKKNPEKAAYAVPGLGSTPHFLGYLLGKAGGFDFRAVAYRGGPQLMTDLIGGHVASAISVLANFVQDHRTGSLRVLATAGTQRSTLLPDVPTLAETFNTAALRDSTTATEWYSLFAPAGTPGATVQTIYSAIETTLKDKALYDTLVAQGHDPAPLPGPQLRVQINNAQERWRQVIKESGFKIDS